MSKLDVLKRVIPEYMDGASAPTAFTNFSSSLHAYIPVATISEAETVAAAAPPNVFPLFFAVTSEERFYTKFRKDGSLVWTGGRSEIWDSDIYQDHIPRGQWQNFGLRTPKQGRLSGKFQLSADNVTLTLPSSGVWLMQLNVWLNTTITNDAAARTLIEIRVNNEPLAYRAVARGEDVITVTHVKYQDAGAKISAWAFQNWADNIPLRAGNISLINVGTV
ncbi:hypothetical protein [Actinobaculum massiliense]|uniref:hypothetical protein n=1 Tax=Actinobaculum massiliense TaxID=202789 RepID=UPI00071AF8B2|nr:hypothetical protein [Actinobaculum massiliense]